MIPFANNPWFVAIVRGASGAILGGIALFYLLEHRAQRRAKSGLLGRIDTADKLLEKNTERALSEYEDITKIPSVAKYPHIYVRIKHNEGIGYCKLAEVRNKERTSARQLQPMRRL